MKDTYIKQVFNNFGKDDTQNIFTPPELCREMLSQIKFKGSEKVLVLYNLEFALILNKEFGLPASNIYIYTNSKTKQVFSKYGFEVLYFEDTLGIKSIDMKFDIVIGNPPFNKDEFTNKKANRSFYLSFVDKARKLSHNKVLMIGPTSYLYKSKNKGIVKLIETKLFYNIHLPISWVVIDPNINVNTFVDNNIKYQKLELNQSLAKLYVGNTGTKDTGINLYSKVLTEQKMNDDDVAIHTSINKIKYTNDKKAIEVFKKENSYGHWRVVWTMMGKNLRKSTSTTKEDLLYIPLY